MGEVKRFTNSNNAEFLNAYSILDLEKLSWDIATYTVVQLNGDEAKHEDRGKIRDVMWDLRRQHREQCPGYGFIVDVDEVTVAVPQGWNIPRQDDFNGYRVIPDRKFKAQASDASYHVIIAGVLRESIKQHFKGNGYESEIGPLWQDYNDFCQMPDFTQSDQSITYCRKFHVFPELLNLGLWVLQTEVTTSGIDIRTFEDYYRSGEVQQLAEMIQKNRANRLTRENKPIAIRVWCSQENKVLEIENPEAIIAHASFLPADQVDLANGTVRCKQFKKPPTEVPLGEVRLIPDTQTSQEHHRETIIAPNERMQWYGKLRDFLNGMDAYRNTIHLDESPVDAHQFDSTSFIHPKLHVNPSPEGVDFIPAPKDGSPQELKHRRQRLADHLRKYGYLQQRPINPLLTYHKSFGTARAKRLKRDLNWQVEQQELNFRFEELGGYETVHDIKRKVEQGKYDTLFVVLPEGHHQKHSDSDTHEKVKKEISIPSQCLHHDNTLPKEWVDRSWQEFKEANRRKAREIQEHYNQCILNLLVKHHWVPFAPADAFHYNVHIGIDVGGKSNNRVMVCVGYGFMQPSEGLTFLLKEVNVETQKVEPKKKAREALFRGCHDFRS